MLPMLLQIVKEIGKSEDESNQQNTSPRIFFISLHHKITEWKDIEENSNYLNGAFPENRFSLKDGIRNPNIQVFQKEITYDHHY
jgi:hypothetical protein